MTAEAYLSVGIGWKMLEELIELSGHSRPACVGTLVAVAEARLGGLAARMPMAPAWGVLDGSPAAAGEPWR